MRGNCLGGWQLLQCRQRSICVTRSSDDALKPTSPVAEAIPTTHCRLQKAAQLVPGDGWHYGLPLSHQGCKTAAEHLDCQQCGACCFSGTERFIRVMGDDYTRLGDAAEKLVHFVGHRAFMRMTDGHCAALRIDPKSRHFTCQLYESRPDVCRDLASGSPACRGEQLTKADLVLVSLRAKPVGG